MKELEIKLYGKVQGVGMRKRVAALAIGYERDIVGYVMNTDAGSVEILAQGAESDLEEFLKEVFFLFTRKVNMQGIYGVMTMLRFKKDIRKV